MIPRNIGDDEVFIGRVLTEDDAFIVLEVVKDNDRELTVDAGDHFLTVVFVQQGHDGSVSPWVPWGDN